MLATLLRVRFTRSPLLIALSAVFVCTLAIGSVHAGVRAERARAKLFAFVNHYRVQHGEPKLRDRPAVDRIAWRHSEKMADGRTLYHSTSMWTKLRAYDPNTWGENVGMGPSVWSVFNGWVKSSPHRANMLASRFRSAGVGVVRSHGARWITMIFYG